VENQDFLEVLVHQVLMDHLEKEDSGDQQVLMVLVVSQVLQVNKVQEVQLDFLV